MLYNKIWPEPDLGGKDEWQRAKIDEIADLQKDLAQELSVYVGTALGMRDGDKAQRSELRNSHVLESIFRAHLGRRSISQPLIEYFPSTLGN